MAPRALFRCPVTVLLVLVAIDMRNSENERQARGRLSRSQADKGPGEPLLPAFPRGPCQDHEALNADET